MEKNKRAFVKYSKRGKIIPGTTIITSGSYPKGGPYKEIPYDLCCDDTPSSCLSGDPINIPPYQVLIEGQGIQFANQSNTNTIFLSIYCSPDYEMYWEGEYETPLLNTPEEVLNYLNTVFGYLGVFALVPLDISPNIYGVELNTTTGVLNFLFPGECNNFLVYVENYVSG